MAQDERGPRRANGRARGWALLGALLLAIPVPPSATAAIPTVLFSENFDGGSAPGWDLTEEWRVTSCRSNSASFSLGFNHGNCPPAHGRGGGAAHSPIVQLPAGYTNILLKFKSWYKTTGCTSPPSCDLLTVSLSTDNWQTSTELYNEDETSNAAKWNDRSLDLSNFDGKQVSIGFWFDAAFDNNPAEGWYVDDLRIEATVEAPPAPRNLDAQRGTGVGEIRLTWTPPAKDGGSPITGYAVYRGSTAGGETFLTNVGNVLSYTDTGLPNGATRFYKVKAVNAEGEGDPSNGDSATAPDVPTAPQALQAARGSAVGTIRLDWNAPANSNGLAVTNYKVYRGNVSGAQTLLTTLGDVRSFTDSGLPNGAKRFYKLTAVNAAGEGAQSAEVSATAPDVPAAPQGPAAARGTNAGEIKVTWSAPSTDNGLAVTAYRVYRGEDSGSQSFLAEVGDVRSFTDMGLPNGARRFYKVSAVNAAGEGPRSAEVSATAPDVPGKPQNPQAVPWVGLGQVRLTWSAPADNGGFAVTNYRIYRTSEQSGQQEFVVQVGNVNAFIDGGRKLGDVYHYRVSAVNALGEGAQSEDTFAPGTQP